MAGIPCFRAFTSYLKHHTMFSDFITENLSIVGAQAIKIAFDSDFKALFDDQRCHWGSSALQ